jgi:hypothetical protein
MPIFPSDEWAKAFQDELNRSDLYAQLAKDWSATYLFAVEPEGPLTAPVYMYAGLMKKRFRRAVQVDPAFVPLCGKRQRVLC